MDKGYRIHTSITNDIVLNVDMQQDFDFLEVLSLKLNQEDAYRLHSSNYGVIMGRVLANDAFGVPNAKVSLFIKRDSNDTSDIEAIYPYTEVLSNDREGRRYNLLPDSSDDDCYSVVGTFPSKRLMLDSDVMLEVYDKYWKYTTVTNQSGDYMLFGVPSGSQQIHVDVDLSDIGILSQKPRDFEYKGYNLTLFENPNQFKTSTSLDSLAQIFSQNHSVFVYPFWGDENNGIAAITRSDIQIEYKFEPTCVFMGSIISDNDGHAIGHKCSPDVENGMNEQLIAGQGTIEMIRKTPDGVIEEFQIQGNQLINENGVWCYQIPMNLDYIGTDEYGNIVPTDNPNKGIPTRAQVRFRISKNETGNEGHSRHTAKYLVPMNPPLYAENGNPQSVESGIEIEKMYQFGSNTPESCFRDLYWNNVYSVKNYIPKIQTARRAYAPNYSALKGSNLATDQNQIPFNKLRIDMPFVYILLCVIFQIITVVVIAVNTIISVINAIIGLIREILGVCISIFGIRICPFAWLLKFVPDFIGCVSLGGGLSPDNTAYYPGCCLINRTGLNHSSCPEDMDNCKKSCNEQDLWDLVQRKLAEDFKIVKLDFYEDWLNGSLYMPLWYWRKRAKRTYLFGLFSSSAKNEFCDCDRVYTRLKSFMTCVINYRNKNLGVNDGVLSEREDSWHRKRRSQIGFAHGVIKGVTNKDGLTAYYYTAIQPSGGDISTTLPMNKQPQDFEAIRLYATDIILLGNLNENNLYGIPQFFKALPSTTANVPPIATVFDGEDISDANEAILDKETLEDREGGSILTTGMDWGHYGDIQVPRFREGLLIDLNCVKGYTKAKSCINVERLSELGVSNDMTFNMTYPTSNGPKQGKIEADGFITKYELDDIENRAMFATMNHLGFTPQSYQDKLYEANYPTNISYDTQVHDSNTNYLIPKFKYLYPVDFDGRLDPILKRYKVDFPYAMADVKSEAYVNFRLGENHMFYNSNTIPLYNNSFYFYFGVNKGKTAIEKFNEMYYAQCFQNEKYPFTMDVSYLGKSYCPSFYKSSGDGESFIAFYSDDIAVPYSYKLFDSKNNVVDKDVDLSDNTFTIKNQDNGRYSLVVTDANGQSQTKKLTLAMSPISLDYEIRELGLKYVSGNTFIESIMCQNENYGLITIDGFYIDSYRFEIQDVDVNYYSQASHLVITITAATCVENLDKFKNNLSIAKIDITIGESDICGTSKDEIFVDKTTEEGKTIKVIQLKIKHPKVYRTVVRQCCNENCTCESGCNESEYAMNVPNGANFYGFINSVPIEFIMDMDGQTSAYSPYKSYKSWLNVNQEKEDGYAFYHFPKEDFNWKRSVAIPWGEYIRIDQMESATTFDLTNIVYSKFNYMFKLSNAVYTSDGGSNTFNFSSTGGRQPILYRSLVPYFRDEELIGSTYLFSDNNMVSLNDAYPDVVGSNYNGFNPSTPKNIPDLNPFIKRVNGREGNMFAAFTNNGGYINAYRIDANKYVAATPSNAYGHVNLSTTVKPLGEDMDISSNGLINSGTTYYFNAKFVDRRMDYDLEIYAPTVVTNITSGLTDTQKKQLGTTRIKGVIYNGIEMSYDNDYNIISGDVVQVPRPQYVVETETVIDDEGRATVVEKTDRYGNPIYKTDENGDLIPKRNLITGEIIYEVDDEGHLVLYDNEEGIVTPNPHLEYSYCNDTNNANSGKTIYTHSRNDISYKWESFGNDISDMIISGATSGGSQMTGTTRLPSYYSAYSRDVDMRLMFWSKKSAEWLNNYCSSWFNSWENSGNTKFHLYSLPVGSTTIYNDLFSDENYPIKRGLDIGFIESAETFSMHISSCSYDGGLEINENNIITAEVGENGGIDLDFRYGEMLKSLAKMPSVSGDASYGIMYDYDKPWNYGKIVQIGYKYEYGFQNEFNTYISMPLLVEKNAALSAKTGGELTFFGNAVAYQRILVRNADAYGLAYADNNFLLEKRDVNELIECSDSMIGDITAVHDLRDYSFSDNSVLYPCVKRVFRPRSKDNLTKNLVLYEFLDPFQCRIPDGQVGTELISGSVTVESETISGDYTTVKITKDGMFNSDDIKASVFYAVGALVPKYGWLRADIDISVNRQREEIITIIPNIEDFPNGSGYTFKQLKNSPSFPGETIVNTLAFFITVNNKNRYIIKFQGELEGFWNN